MSGHEHTWMRLSHHRPPSGLLICTTPYCGETKTCEDHVWQDRKHWVRCTLCGVLKPCHDRSHGIVCKDEREGPGYYCRICGGPVPGDDVVARTKLERVRGAINSLERLAYDAADTKEMVKPWVARLKGEAKKITGTAEERSPMAPKL